MQSVINIRNKKAYFDYEIIEKFVAGIQLKGTEIKSLRQGKASLSEAYCYFTSHELWLKSMRITEYENATFFNHEPYRERKLLMNRRELNKLEKQTREKGLTIIVLRVFLNDRGLAKAEIALAKGKKQYDKREAIKKKDLKRDMDRITAQRRS